MRLGRRIEQCRAVQGFSLKEAALLIGVQWQSWQQWESGRTSPTPDKLHKIAALLNTSPDDLLSDKPFRVPGTRSKWAPVEPDNDLIRARKALLDAYERLPPELRVQILALIQTLSQFDV